MSKHSVDKMYADGPQTYMVTGGAGFIGSHLVRHMVSMGHTVHVVDNLSTGKASNIPINDVFFHPIDVRGLTRSDIPDDVDVIFHMAALPSVERSMKVPRKITNVNVDGTVNVLESAARAGVRRVVYSSSSSVYGDREVLPKSLAQGMCPSSPYAASKAAGEHYCHVYDRMDRIETVSLRYFNVFGPRQDPHGSYPAVIPRFIDQMLDEDTDSYTVYGDGMQSRDFTYVSNVVLANMLAGTAPSDQMMQNTYNVGCGEHYTLREVIDTINKHDPSSSMSIDFQSPREGDVRHSLANINPIKVDLGYEVDFGFTEGVSQTIRWHKEQNR